MFAGMRLLPGVNATDEEVTALELRPPEHGGKCGGTGSLFVPKIVLIGGSFVVVLQDRKLCTKNYLIIFFI